MEPVCIGLDEHQRPIKRISSKTLLSEMAQVFKQDEKIYSLTLCPNSEDMETRTKKPVETQVWTIDRLICGC